MNWERVTAGEIGPGDRVARSRNHEPNTVVAVKRGPVSITLLEPYEPSGWERERYHDAPNVRCFARPRMTAKWWRVVE